MSTLLDGQIGFIAETAYNTPPAVTNFLELASESIKPNYPILTGSGFRPGQHVVRSDRVLRPGMKGGAGAITFQPLTKGGNSLSRWLALALGAVSSTTTTTDSVYTHTGTFGDLLGDSVAIQVGRPDTSGTVQPFTYGGGKVGGLSLSTNVDGLLEATVDLAYVASETTSTSLASASYTSGAEPFAWTKGDLTLAGSSIAITDMAIALRNTLKERWFMNNTQKEPLVAGFPSREVTVRFNMEFESLTHLNYTRDTVTATGQKKLVATWSGPTLAGASAYPRIRATVEVADLVADSYPSISGQDMIMLGFTGTARYDGTNSPLKIEVDSTEATP